MISALKRQPDAVHLPKQVHRIHKSGKIRQRKAQAWRALIQQLSSGR